MQRNIEIFGEDPKNCSLVFDRPTRIEVHNPLYTLLLHFKLPHELKLEIKR